MRLEITSQQRPAPQRHLGEQHLASTNAAKHPNVAVGMGTGNKQHMENRATDPCKPGVSCR